MKKLLLIIIVAVFLIGIVSGYNNFPYTYAVEDTNLRIVLKSPLKSIGADGNKYPIYIEIQNSKGEPVELNHDIKIRLFSSDNRIGTVPDEVVFPKGSFYKIVYFQSTSTPGSTIITAMSPGFESASLLLKTYHSVGYPVMISVYIFPNRIPLNSVEKPLIVVQLEDTLGKPARAPKVTTVSLFSSNPLVGVPEEDLITIQVGSTYGLTYFNFVNETGTTIITASTSGFASGHAEITVIPEEWASSPVRLRLGVEVRNIRATGKKYPFLYVQLLDEKNETAIADQDILIKLSSSNEEYISIPDKVIIPKGSSFTSIELTTSSLPGSSLITASATGYESDSIEVYTIEPFPSILSCISYTTLVARGDKYPIFIQLLDSNGNPAKPELPVKISLVSSNPETMDVPFDVILDEGEPYVEVDVSTSTLEGQSTISIAASGYSPTSLKLRSVLLPLSIEISSEKDSILSNESLPLTVSVSHRNMPVSGVKVELSSSLGAINESGYTNDNGIYTSVYTPILPGTDTINVVATKPGYKLVYQNYTVHIDKYVTIRVKTLTEGGDPIEGLKVFAIDSRGMETSATTDYSGVAVLRNVKWGDVIISVEDVHSTSNTKYVFSQWDTGEKNATLEKYIVDDELFTAVFNIQYFVSITSEYGSIYGSGWYPKGTSVTIGVEETSVPVNFLVSKKFDGWTGDVTSSDPSVVVMVYSPMHVEAVWVDDYTNLYILIAVIAAIIVIIIVLYYLYKKGKIFKKPKEEEEEEGLFLEEEEFREEMEEHPPEGVEEKKIEETEEVEKTEEEKEFENKEEET